MAKSNERKHQQRILLVFLLLLILPGCLGYFLKDRDYSSRENRPLQQKPVFSASAFASGAFQKDYTGYLEDQFPWRDGFIAAKARSEKLLLAQENNEVFINNGQVLMEKFTPNDDKLLTLKANAMNAFADKNRRAKFSVMLVPNKVEVLKEHLPAFAPMPSQADFLKDFYEKLSNRFTKIDLIPTFRTHRKGYLYFNTDHHWTQEGAFRAQAEYFKAVQMEPRPESDYEVRRVADDFQGTLAAKSGLRLSRGDDLNLYVPKSPEDVIITQDQVKTASFYHADKVDGQDKYLVFLGGNYPLVRVTTASQADRRLMVIKDSYANAFLPFLSKAFNEITVVDLRYFRGDVNKLMADYLITDVLFLYNINTFHDDNSILNLTDDLLEAEEETEEKTVQMTVDSDDKTPQVIRLQIKNNTLMDISYFKKVKLELQTEGGYVEVKSLPEASFEEGASLVGSKAISEYKLNLRKLFGPLKKGTYRLTQVYNTDSVMSEIITLPNIP